MPDLWIPGVAEPSLDDFVGRVHKQIERYTTTHRAQQTEVEVELADGARLTLQSISAEPGYGFVTLAVHPEDDDGPEQLIVPVNAIRRIALGPAEADRARFGFALPDDDRKRGAEPAA
jgi:hypothetical protein